MALRDSMRASAAPYLRPGEPVRGVFGAPTHSQWLAPLTGRFFTDLQAADSQVTVA